ncbi:MAG: HAMP domain-containing sensor histidine kinase [Candidatus Eisenbacteria bacterium]|nr:HAMP domain-containing sensor histidine kinase [Candidatus Eisenbacteria bacterium]
MKTSRAVWPSILRGYVFLGGSILVAAVFLYTNDLIKRLDNQASILRDVLARFCATASFPGTENPEVKRIFNEVVQGINFPVVLTDVDGRPFVWRGIGIDPDAVTVEQSFAMDPKNPPPGPLARIVEITKKLDKQHPPVPMVMAGTSRMVGLVHYGESAVVEELRWVPVAELLVIGLFVLLGYLGMRSVRIAEQRSIWAGMAKETAHQLGTPLSSMLGWIEVARDKLESVPGGPGEAGSQKLKEVLDEMENDAERLKRVASRFSHVGSPPKLHPQDIVPIVSEAVEYFERRLPRLGKEVEIETKYGIVPPVNLNKELIGWAIENVLRNALDAIDPGGGTIEVEVLRRKKTESVEVVVRDTGRGMAPAQAKRIFEPGFSTKKHGWGLGLSLAKRIVEDYHGGRLSLRETAPGKGTVLAMSFPV